MSVSELIARVRQLMLAPRETLPLTLAESGEWRAVLVPYVVALAAVGPVVGFLSTGIIGMYQPATTIFNTTVPASYIRMPGTALVAGILQLALNAGAWWFLAWILGKLAPSFDGREDRGGAFKAAACIATPVWLSGALTLLHSLPHLGGLVVVGEIAALAYAVFIGIWAVPLLLSVPEPKAPGHVLAALGITVVVAIAAQWLLTMLLIAPFVGALFR
jgi:hypothetical protein